MSAFRVLGGRVDRGHFSRTAAGRHDRDPCGSVTHIDQLAGPGKVSFVMKEGKVLKDER
jgi:hypothetical protein